MIIEIEDKLISLDIFEKYFVCDYAACKGICCVEGDSGAPLLDEEVEKLEEALPIVLPRLSKRAQEVIAQEGVSVVDQEGDLVTPIVEGRECVFTLFDEEGSCRCALEMAWEAGEIDFPKPISCALYPIRVKQHAQFTALNYDKWSICKAALKKGRREGVPLFRFLRNPLTRAYGRGFYREMETAYQALVSEGMIEP